MLIAEANIGRLSSLESSLYTRFRKLQIVRSCSICDSALYPHAQVTHEVTSSLCPKHLSAKAEGCQNGGHAWRPL